MYPHTCVMPTSANITLHSRYCYGGMRKKTDTQAPVLPDLTVELSGTSDAFHLSGPPSSISSDDPEVRSALGAEGSAVVNATRIVIEYAQTVIGGQFSSLLQLALHLIKNRHVSGHSTHALSLLSYSQQNHQQRQQQQRKNPPAQSLSASNIITPESVSQNALREAVEKSKYKIFLFRKGAG